MVFPKDLVLVPEENSFLSLKVNGFLLEISDSDFQPFKSKVKSESLQVIFLEGLQSVSSYYPKIYSLSFTGELRLIDLLLLTFFSIFY